ncbi:unnamed protein product [Cylicocyclus nassatus]|uniref:Uncharacterized protein n=1 Tax=Cylicocyclus nassatus TaxID=53992 RepID=A0AA36HCN7_CYLNA|nr:unnamed protein product [Cylicocyclus nassatus]
MCYTFTYKRHGADHILYLCQQCKSKGKWIGIKVEFLTAYGHILDWVLGVERRISKFVNYHGHLDYPTAYSQLNTLITREHPQLGKLIEVLRNINEETDSALTTLEQRPSQTKHLRNRDRERRERIISHMRRFTDEYNSGISRARIETYCRTMARFVSNRTI